jgi:hypothetical protein
MIRTLTSIKEFLFNSDIKQTIVMKQAVDELDIDNIRTMNKSERGKALGDYIMKKVNEEKSQKSGHS